jgi:hypothetical protein
MKPREYRAKVADEAGLLHCESILMPNTLNPEAGLPKTNSSAGHEITKKSGLLQQRYFRILS